MLLLEFVRSQVANARDSGRWNPAKSFQREPSSVPATLGFFGHARRTAPSHVAALGPIPNGGPVGVPSMIAVPAYQMSRPATASKPVTHLSRIVGINAQDTCIVGSNKDCTPIGTQDKNSNSLFSNGS